MPQTYFQKYTIVCFFYPQDLPASFSALDWPLHVTMLDTFKTDWSVEELGDAMQRVAAAIPAFTALPVEQAMLGPNKDVPVKLLQQDEPMLAFHRALLALQQDGNFVFNTPEFVGDGFLPHATDQKDGQLAIGTPYPVTTVSLVDMFPNGDHMQRAVVSTIPLPAQ